VRISTNCIKLLAFGFAPEFAEQTAVLAANKTKDFTGAETFAMFGSS
jgi:hypothetical protein